MRGWRCRRVVRRKIWVKSVISVNSGSCTVTRSTEYVLIALSMRSVGGNRGIASDLFNTEVGIGLRDSLLPNNPPTPRHDLSPFFIIHTPSSQPPKFQFLPPTLAFTISPSHGCSASAWDTVEELNAAASHAKDAAKSKDPLEQYCAEDPAADECRVYED